VEEDPKKKWELNLSKLLAKIETILVLVYEFFIPETYLWQKGEEEEEKK
jgi:hypothetical protein